MKSSRLVRALLLLFLVVQLSGHAQTAPASAPAEDKAAAARAKSDADQQKKAAEWVASLRLEDAAKVARLQAVIVAHLKAVRDWHNAHPFSTVPEGVNPATGKPLNNLDRQMIADGAMPKSVHAALLAGLRADLTPAQVEAILDKYTVGKVAFTLKGYHAIVPDLTPAEEATILGFLQQAREEAVDYKNMNQISAIFEIYKTKSEQFLISNGRDWKKLFKAYVDGVKAQKAAAAKFSGTWDLAVETGQGTGNPVFTFTQEGEKLTGRYQGAFGEAPVTGTLRGSEVKFSFKVSGEGQAFECIYTGTVSGDTVKGKVQFGGLGEGTFTGKKQPK